MPIIEKLDPDVAMRSRAAKLFDSYDKTVLLGQRLYAAEAVNMGTDTANEYLVDRLNRACREITCTGLLKLQALYCRFPEEDRPVWPDPLDFRSLIESPRFEYRRGQIRGSVYRQDWLYGHRRADMTLPRRHAIRLLALFVAYRKLEEESCQS